jgi:predicted MFS family arabinose efflux permease/copper chaperone CopZ
MTASERRAITSLAMVYATRMLGLFMVLPVFMLYGQNLIGANEMLLGLAIGAYGLSQAMLQIPFGALSDRIGRKKLIVFGLFLFFLGSVIAATSTSIYGVILGRFIQGSGAVASVLIALLSDLTTIETRTKAMAIIGMSIGVSFIAALVIGPYISHLFGLSGLFWLTAAFAVFGIVWVIYVVPTPVQSVKNRDTRLFKEQLLQVIGNRELFRLDYGIFTLHMTLTAMFVAVPLTLINTVHLAKDKHWLMYLSVMGASFFAMLPFIIVAEKYRKMKPVFVGAIGLLAVSAFSAIWTDTNLEEFWVTLFFFFMAFNLLEATLPSLVSKISPAGSKGTAMGVYSTSQFFGAFVGGALGGWVISTWGSDGIYTMAMVVGTLWFVVAMRMEAPGAITGMTLQFSNMATEEDALRINDELHDVIGVEEVVVVMEDSLAYLKVNKDMLDKEALDRLVEKG